MRTGRPSGPIPGTAEFTADAEHRLLAVLEDDRRRWIELVEPADAAVRAELERRRLDDLAYRVMLRRRWRRIERRVRRDLASATDPEAAEAAQE